MIYDENQYQTLQVIYNNSYIIVYMHDLLINIYRYIINSIVCVRFRRLRQHIWSDFEGSFCFHSLVCFLVCVCIYYLYSLYIFCLFSMVLLLAFFDCSLTCSRTFNCPSLRWVAIYVLKNIKTLAGSWQRFCMPSGV